ncbi:hypothetical protein JB92DRAFT_1326670 [Gautieria morchelliformis]|nr:hypothetical protein JB92DRAFT_1326670 [Gautieria morchelliformis]
MLIIVIFKRSPSRHEYPVTNENSREHRPHDRWRQGESSSFSSTHNRYTHASDTNTYDSQRRDDYYDRAEDRYSTSSTRGWVEHSDRDYASSSRIDRSWASNSRYDVKASEYDRWEGRERDVGRDGYAVSERRKDSFENEEDSRGRDRSWTTRDQDWDREPNQRRKEWTRDSRSSWTTGAASTRTSTEDRSWKPAASWQPGDRHHSQQGTQNVGAYNKRKPKKHNQVQGRRGWNDQYSRKPHDWRDGPSNWHDPPSNKDKEKVLVHDQPQANYDSRGTKRRHGSTSRSRSRSPLSRSSSIAYSRTSKRPRRQAAAVVAARPGA